jgi:hypothetical protein
METPGRKGEREKLCGCMQTSKDPVYKMTLHTLPLLILHLWPICMSRSYTGGQSLNGCPEEGVTDWIHLAGSGVKPWNVEKFSVG